MITELSKDVKTALDVVRAEMTNLSARLNLTIRSVGNQTPTRRAVQFNKIKV